MTRNRECFQGRNGGRVECFCRVRTLRTIILIKTKQRQIESESQCKINSNIAMSTSEGPVKALRYVYHNGGLVKSGNSDERSYVRFFNSSKTKIVDYVWIDYKGSCVRYGSIAPRGTRDVNTFATHPWIFWDSSQNSRKRMVVNSTTNGTKDDKLSFIFYPQGYNHGQEVKRAVIIKEPMVTLETCCFDTLIKNGVDSRNIKGLMIPTNISDQFIEYYEESNCCNKLYSNNYKLIKQ